ATTTEMRDFGGCFYETRIAVGGIQSHAHVNARAAVPQRFSDPSSTILELGHLGEDAGVHGEIRLHECDDGAWAQLLREMAKGGCRIRQIQQDETSDQRIEGLGVRKILEFRGLEADVRVAGFG